MLIFEICLMKVNLIQNSDVINVWIGTFSRSIIAVMMTRLVQLRSQKFFSRKNWKNPWNSESRYWYFHVYVINDGLLGVYKPIRADESLQIFTRNPKKVLSWPENCRQRRKKRTKDKNSNISTHLPLYGLYSRFAFGVMISYSTIFFLLHKILLWLFFNELWRNINEPNLK